EVRRLLDTAHWHLLRAETSCNFFWGDAWLYKTHKDLDDAAWHLGEAQPFLKEALVEASAPAEEAVAPSLPSAAAASVDTTAGVDTEEPPPA
ncbi:MAG TPA: hypothetical protein PLQ12_07690, partial [Candidatus Defluviicoccus seviourii]|nr:hypothetical protein [Candidatus Defluviicoccus seviourii]